MALPSVKIDITSGNLGRSLDLSDGVAGVIATKVDLVKPNLFYTLGKVDGSATVKVGLWTNTTNFIYNTAFAVYKTPDVKGDSNKITEVELKEDGTEQIVYIVGLLLRPPATTTTLIAGNKVGVYYDKADKKVKAKYKESKSIEGTDHLTLTYNELTAYTNAVTTVDTIIDWSTITTVKVVEDTSALPANKAQAITSLENAKARFGISESNNGHIYTILKNYFESVGGNQLIYLMPVAASVTMEDMLDESKGHIKGLQVIAKGKMRLLGVSRLSSGTPTIKNGIDQDVDKALVKGEAAAVAFENKMQPFRFGVDGKNFNSVFSDLKDYNTSAFKHGSVFLSNTKDNKNSNIGMFLGALSKQPVQRKISRVRNGALPITQDMYIGNSSVESSIDQWDMLHDKGYIFLRTHAGKDGYYFSSDRTADNIADDYSSLARGRVIDKARVVMYATVIDYLDDEIQLDDTGKLLPGIVKEMEGVIENAISTNLVGAISSVEAAIDPDQNILSNDTLKAKVAIIPLAYATKIEIELGFENPLKK